MFDEPASRSPEGRDEPGGRTSPPLLDSKELRTRFIDCYLNFSISKELSQWLQDLGLPSTGTTQEKLARLHRHAGSLVLPAESFLRQTIYYLNKYDEDILSEICQELGIDGTGPKDVLVTRIYREVGLREGWLQPLSEDARQIITNTFIPILEGFDHNKTIISTSGMNCLMCSAKTMYACMIPKLTGAPSWQARFLGNPHGSHFIYEQKNIPVHKCHQFDNGVWYAKPCKTGTQPTYGSRKGKGNYQ